ncbi:hypothetical protein GCM10009422_02610 [Brevundimonas kwangchunensis]|uniref:O-antigen ligase-related domain-containing protein n=1 Tax=Brevundimonas kwangchunensis TaxID=322163 RepID=A0ABP3RIS9_9CAUL
MIQKNHFSLKDWIPASLATIILLVVAFVFGGASRQHELRLALVELVALPTLTLAIFALTRSSAPNRGNTLAFSVLAAVVLLPIVQLAPLPPQIWTILPGRQEMVLAQELAGVPPGWSTLSLTPDRTWRSALALLPPVAMFLAVLSADRRTRHTLALLLLGVTAVSILLGAAQLASGGNRLYPWRTTDAGHVVGFFANRNHLATLCLASIPFAFVLGARASRNRQANSRIWLWIFGLAIGLAIVALGVIRSRAGIILAGPVIGAGLLAAWVATDRGRPKPVVLVMTGASVIAVVLISIFALAPLLERFDTGGAGEARFDNWPIVLAASDTFLPLGSGLGSFDSVFRSVEPMATLDGTFFNQAHNDYLETWLEAGWLGAGIIVLFLIWYARRSWTAWRSGAGLDRDLQRASSIAIGVILVHSLADYPLRTVAISTLFAMAAALLELARTSGGQQPAHRTRRQRT